MEKKKTEESMNDYIQQKEVCVEMSISKQTSYYSRLVKGSSGSQKSLFKVANELLDKTSKKVLPSHEDAKELANELSQFYIDKVNKIRESIPVVEDIPEYYARPFMGERMMKFQPTTEEELLEIMNQSGIKTSMEDPIPARVLQSLDNVTGATSINQIDQ